MKTLLTIVLAATLAASAYATHSYHGWRKISEQTTVDGMKICQWRCTYDTFAIHETVTQGRRCPRPR